MHRLSIGRQAAHRVLRFYSCEITPEIRSVSICDSINEGCIPHDRRRYPTDRGVVDQRVANFQLAMTLLQVD